MNDRYPLDSFELKITLWSDGPYQLGVSCGDAMHGGHEYGHRVYSSDTWALTEVVRHAQILLRGWHETGCIGMVAAEEALPLALHST